MEQHIILGRGAPTEKPLKVSMHYIDLDTQAVYLARGIESVNDWGSPLVGRTELDDILAAFNPYADGPPKTLSKTITVQGTLDNRFVKFYPNKTVDGGRFIVVRDDNNLETIFDAQLSDVDTVRENEEIVVFNATIAPMRLVPGSTHDLIWSARTTSRVSARGVVTLKLINTPAPGDKYLWAVFGDIEFDG